MGRIWAINDIGMTKSVWPIWRTTARMTAGNMNTEPRHHESGSEIESALRCEVCPLSCVKAGVAVRIKRLCAAPEVQERLREIGLCEEQVIRLLTSHTNFICQVCNARLAISEQLARLIMVEPMPVPVSSR